MAQKSSTCLTRRFGLNSNEARSRNRDASLPELREVDATCPPLTWAMWGRPVVLLPKSLIENLDQRRAPHLAATRTGPPAPARSLGALAGTRRHRPSVVATARVVRPAEFAPGLRTMLRCMGRPSLSRTRTHLRCNATENRRFSGRSPRAASHRRRRLRRSSPIEKEIGDDSQGRFGRSFVIEAVDRIRNDRTGGYAVFGSCDMGGAGRSG